MNRKKFFGLISTGVLGYAFLKAIPIKLFTLRNSPKSENPVKVKANSFAVKREKSGKKNG